MRIKMKIKCMYNVSSTTCNCRIKYGIYLVVKDSFHNMNPFYYLVLFFIELYNVE